MRLEPNPNKDKIRKMINLINAQKDRNMKLADKIAKD